MKYRVTTLSPTLIGDGQKLAPIDYMVWKDHVNVLDQRRIFKLLAKGPRLDGYLAQLKKAQRLDFASWGGFAQNFAGRRIPFEHPTSIAAWERAPAEQLFIPTFAANLTGAFLPATALKGALRTGLVFDRWNDGTLQEMEKRFKEERIPRQPALQSEEAVLGGRNSRVRRIAAADSASVSYTGMKVYLVRVATLVAKGGGKLELGWKSLRGSTDARRIEESTPSFVEMASPGTTFEGDWREASVGDRHKIFAAANKYAASQLARHKQYAQSSGLTHLVANLEAMEARLQGLRGEACLLSIGWGGGMLSKIPVEDINGQAYRSLLKQFALYNRTLETGLPFPKTRRVVFEGGQPAQLPGWVLLEVQ